MDKHLIRMECDKCGIVWRFSLAKWRLGHNVYCPFCGNRQFRSLARQFAASAAPSEAGSAERADESPEESEFPAAHPVG